VLTPAAQVATNATDGHNERGESNAAVAWLNHIRFSTQIQSPRATVQGVAVTSIYQEG
jgi:hypothetical protein